MHPDLSRAIENRRAELEGLGPRFRRLQAAVNEPGGQLRGDYFVLYALTRDFSPDLILEIGRGRGNSTCIFLEAASRIPGCRVVSVDPVDAWSEMTVPRLRGVVEPAWLDPLTVRVGDICSFAAEDLVGEARRILLFWDAHDRKAADHILSRLLPRIARGENLVLVHDVGDRRFVPAERSRWHDHDRNRIWWMGRWVSAFEELPPLYDFWCRNGIEPTSYGEQLHRKPAAEWLAEWSRDDPRVREAGTPWSYCVYFSVPPEGFRDGESAFPPEGYRDLYQRIGDVRPKTLLVYGAGGGGRHFLRKAALYGVRPPVAAFLDRDETKWGTTLEGIPVHSPRELGRYRPDETFVVIASVHFREIAETLARSGWPARATGW